MHGRGSWRKRWTSHYDFGHNLLKTKQEVDSSGHFCLSFFGLHGDLVVSHGHLSLVAVHGLSYPLACGIFVPWPGIEPASPPLEGRFLTTGVPGKSQLCPLLQKEGALQGRTSLTKPAASLGCSIFEVENGINLQTTDLQANTGDVGLIPVWELRSHMPRSY